MACRTIHFPRGATAIVCGPRVRRQVRRCVVCNCPDTMCTMKLCDGPRDGGKPGQTCDTPVCVDCAHHIEPDTDYCPQHAPLARSLNHPGHLNHGGRP
jgi:hypothetical protein